MILGIVQARMSSTRLPGKVMLPLLGCPMLEHQLERLLRCKRIDQLLVATSNQSDDLPIVDLCRHLGVMCFQGDLADVLDRFYQASQQYPTQHIVRLTADCPLCDPELIDGLIEFYLNGHFDYASTALEPTFPDGLDAEIFRAELLKLAWQEADLPSQREHVTSFFYQQNQRFCLGSYTDKIDRSAMRWTVDDADDFEFVTQIYKKLYPVKSDFNRHDIVDLLNREPELSQINCAKTRNQGYLKSLELDKLTTKTETH
ncbi:glycosyltransferase family protein [Chitinibacter sp. FCG-7]|uniref:Glycosyltransferase family protein n=1 Tax=Chitinibacter mangrovi TaxID=3153927 RepID=A0AAU7FB13_9NEIS